MRSMNILKASARYTAGLLFRVGILLVPTVAALVTILHNPAFVRRTLADSGIYDSVRAEVLAKSIESTPDPNGKQLLSDPGTQSIILRTFTPGIVQQSSEQLLTDSYRWLDGATPSIQSQLDLTAARDRFLQDITTYAQTRLANLPQCTLQQMRELDVSAQGVLSISCRPPGIDVTQTSNDFTQQVRESTSFLQNPIVTIDTGNVQQTGSGNVQLSRDLPQAYQLLPTLLWAVSTTGVVAATTYLLLSVDKYRAQRILARWLVVTGILVLIGVGIGEFFIRRYVGHSQTGATTAAFRDSVLSIVRGFSNQYHARLLLVASVYLVAGLIWWMIVRRMQPRQQ